MELNQVVQRKKDGKLFMVTGKVGKFFLELKEVATISIQMHVDSKALPVAHHNSEFEECKQVNINIQGRTMHIIDKS